jgi:hypothetical protein
MSVEDLPSSDAAFDESHDCGKDAIGDLAGGQELFEHEVAPLTGRLDQHERADLTA